MPTETDAKALQLQKRLVRAQLSALSRNSNPSHGVFPQALVGYMLCLLGLKSLFHVLGPYFGLVSLDQEELALDIYFMQAIGVCLVKLSDVVFTARATNFNHVAIFCLINYACMMSGFFPAFRARGRIVYPIRNLTWAFTAPLMIQSIMNVVPAHLQRTGRLAQGNMVLCTLSGLVASLAEHNALFIAALACSFVCFFIKIKYVVDLLLVLVDTAELAIDEDRTRLLNSTVLVWGAMPLVWMLAEFEMLTARNEIIITTYLDVLIKALFYNLLSSTICRLKEYSAELSDLYNTQDSKLALANLRVTMKGIFHDLRLTFNSVLLGLHALRADGIDQDSEDVLEGISQSVKETVELLDETMQDMRGKVNDKVVFNLVDVVRSVRERQLIWAVHNNVAVRTEFPLKSELPMVKGSASMIRRILTNYVTNAIKFSDSGSNITIRLCTLPNLLEFEAAITPGLHDGRRKVFTHSQGTGEVPAGHVAVFASVLDHGMGVPATYLATLFEECKPMEHAQNKDGHGLGLYTIRQLLKDMSGGCGVFTKEDVGSEFYVTFHLPMADVPSPLSTPSFFPSAPPAFASCPFPSVSSPSASSLPSDANSGFTPPLPRPGRNLHPAPLINPINPINPNPINLINKPIKSGRAAPKAAQAKGSKGSNANPRLLVVDDVNTNRMLLSRVLVRHGAQVMLAEDGERALAIVGSLGVDQFEALLIDNHMNALTGRETTKKLREMGVVCPIYGMSGDAEEEDYALWTAAGATRSMPKPLHLDTLFEWLEKDTKRSFKYQPTPTPEPPQRLKKKNTDDHVASPINRKRRAISTISVSKTLAKAATALTAPSQGQPSGLRKRKETEIAEEEKEETFSEVSSKRLKQT